MAEVPCTGKGRTDYAALMAVMRRKHPLVSEGDLRRTGSVIEVRDDTNPGWIEVAPGLTLRQLFDPATVEEQPATSREIGRVFFNGTPCRILLTFQRGAGSCGVTLLPRIKMGDSTINFSNQINPQQLASTLPDILAGVLGSDARALELNLREKK